MFWFNFKIFINEEQPEIFKRKFDHLWKIYKKQKERSDYIGLIIITVIAYSFINDET